MRPKRPVRPPPTPPPPPAVVTPENLDAINAPAVDKLPAYISVGKFQWKPPLPGPKGDTGAAGTPGAPGAPGEPGATVRPIDPPVTTDEIGNAQVTPEKLSFTPVSRPLDPPVATDEIGNAQVTPEKLSFTPAKLSIGTFVGDGNPTKAITGTGFLPKALIVISVTDPGVMADIFIKITNLGPDAFATSVQGAIHNTAPDQIISLDADGFTVGDTFGMNLLGATFAYIALG